MKREELFELLKDIDEKSIEEAGKYSRKGKRQSWRSWKTLAACLILFVIAGLAAPRIYQSISGPTGPGDSGPTVGVSPGTGTEDQTILAEASYPEPVAADMSVQDFVQSEDYNTWGEEYAGKAEKSEGYRAGMNSYYQTMMEKMLISQDENTVCSPLNTYIALAMLAEITDGNSRQQVLDLLGAADLEDLREQIAALWESNYVDTPALKSLLANSLWLKNSVNYRQDTLDILADNYRASSYSGNPGSEDLDQALRQWTDENTGGLLKEYTKDMVLDPDTVLALVSTIYYRASWLDEFSSEMTTEETFHGTQGDSKVDMMHKTDVMDVCSKDTYTALSLPLRDSGSMYFFLPEEGVDVNELAADPDILDGTVYGEGEEWSRPDVNLSVPKFEVSAKTNLTRIIQDLGVTDVLDPDRADFSPLTSEVENIYLSSAEHAAMVEIDEDGVTGAAYTEMLMAEGTMIAQETLDFVIDRPFLFVITGKDGAVLFSGVVRNID